MIVLSTRQDFLDYRCRWKSPLVGLVPTMGNLHQGHLSLAERSLQDNSLTIVTIFVNPKQFGPQEDFQKYPRTLEQDLALLKKLRANYPDKTMVVFAPSSANEIYPDGFSGEVKIKGQLTEILCARSRPTHFDGVTTVVALLFLLTRPQTAYFGKKDFQQFKVIQKLVGNFNFPLTIVGMPTIRQEDGLAMSSRNQYLSASERPLALLLSQTMRDYAKSFIAQKKISEIVFPDLPSQDMSWDYLELRRSADLNIPNANDKDLVLLGALRLGKTRLIDNLEFNLP